MTPSTEELATISGDQIGKICDLLTADLRQLPLPRAAVQLVIENQGDALVQDIIAVLQKRTDAVSNMIVHRVNVNRGQTPQQALDAMGRNQYTDKTVVAEMPAGQGGKMVVYFFKLNRYVSDDDELAKEYAIRNLQPDPLAQIVVNTADPAIAEEYHNGCHWNNAKGQWCFLAFLRWYDGRGVSVYRHDGVWGDGWWFAGVRN
mgnify:CR=1 FL=1